MREKTIYEIESNYKIKCLLSNEIITFIKKKHVLWTTRCCKIKKESPGLPEQMYESNLVKYFFKFVNKYNLRYAIVSDKYGLHFWYEPKPCYDIHPSTLTETDKNRLARIINQKTIENKFKEIVFYNNSPKMSKPYFDILSKSGINIFYTSKLL